VSSPSGQPTRCDPPWDGCHGTWLAAVTLLDLTLFAALTLGGCDSEGYADVFEGADGPDVFTSCGPTTVWLRNYLAPGYGPGEEDRALRTELLVVHSERDYGTGETRFDQPGCMYSTTIRRDGSLVLEEGVLTTRGGDAGTWTTSWGYAFIHQSSLAPLERSGAQSVESNPPLERPVAFAARGDELTLTVDGEEQHFVDLFALLASADRTTSEGAMLVGQLLNTGVLIAHARIRGFGGAGMTEYLQGRRTVSGMIAGEMSVSGSTGIGTFEFAIAYGGGLEAPFADFTGLALWGGLGAIVNGAGDGHMNGRTDFMVIFDPSEPGRDLVGHFDYEGVEIHNGFGSGGAGTLSLDGTSFSMPIDDLLITDFRGILPLD